MACCPIPDFLKPSIVDKCAAAIIDDKDSPMDMAYGMTQEDVLFWPGIRVSKRFGTLKVGDSFNFYYDLVYFWMHNERHKDHGKRLHTSRWGNKRSGSEV